MKILVTNDDGVDSAGIQELIKALEAKEENQVVAVAPDKEQSATGHAITLYRPLRVKEMNYRDIESKFLAVDGTPADCVKLGVEAILDEEPDLVISGINRGPNLGCDVLYSGTVSAAIEGLLMGIPAVAVSLVSYKDWNFKYAARFVSELMDSFKQSQLREKTILNINIPPLTKEELKGVKVTKLGNRSYTNLFDKRVDPRGETYYWLAGDIVEEENDDESDVAAVNDDYISITPIHLNLTDFSVIDKLKEENLELF
ncbi:5'/3'-nucleotidase SurE [Fuchsiella alkaliacetigena]|uniref:5'/3'-nucleotidase SurE n=1 Tax=Fuchsiella alkaliacetigena TaxID=957042 RepID=UPI00200A28AA|nr:5'/3'-nucleotidase SurE [Fuchsiella alkaliacetigena]MCK8823471.1 5'/3'-nucleotidase SurE [Fuchsiella alkaliacetigena]